MHPRRRSTPATIALVPTEHAERTPVRVHTPDDAWLILEVFARHLRRFQGRPGWQLS